MEYPHGHPTTHAHHHNREEQEYPPPSQQPPPFHGGQSPPPYYSSNEPPPNYGSNPPPPQVIPYADSHVSPTSHHVPGGSGPVPISDHYSQTPPPPLQSHHFNIYSENIQPQTTSDYDSSPPSSDVYVSHNSSNRHESKPEPDRHHYRPHMSSFSHHHQNAPESAAAKTTVRVCTKARTDYSLTIREGKVILAPTDLSDPFQHWIRDEKYSIRVKDEEGFPSFALVNKAFGQAIKHSSRATHPVQLTPYKPDVLDESVLWTESKDLGDGYKAVRMVNNVRLNLDACHGDKNYGGVYDGTIIIVWKWNKGDNQRWKIVPTSFG
ncbi:ricin B-like lectin EULS3 [Actinidia eriantha]|uniref:ricin B-like lectin EULS3 n=1 Tax=Actinidia eriantha TaxID=165200 RepID=UPI0025896115|nr:ricin B-like lectin EULS3 [Actinidia eriantha]